MSEQCPFLDGVAGFQCHQVRALKAAQEETGARDLGITIVQLQEMLCKTGSEASRLKDCPAGRALKANPRDSTYSKPIATYRPTR